MQMILLCSHHRMRHIIYYSMLLRPNNYMGLKYKTHSILFDKDVQFMGSPICFANKCKPLGLMFCNKCKLLSLLISRDI